MFDPYHKWLGIPKDQRPPTFYQLLGISPGETDAEVIDEAAIRQTAHIRTYQIGPQAKECTKVLNEIAQARTALLNPAKRKEYDAFLAKKTAASKKAAESEQITASPPPVQSAFADLEEEGPLLKRPAEKQKRTRPPSIAKEGVFLTKPMLYGLIGGGVGLVLVIVLVLAFAFSGSKPPLADPIVAKKMEEKHKKDPQPLAVADPIPDSEQSQGKKGRFPLAKKDVPPVI